MSLPFQPRYHLCSATLWIGVVAVFACGFVQSQVAPASAAGTQPLPHQQADPIAAAASIPAPSPVSPYRITGAVVDTVTKSPIPNATLTVEPMNSGSRNRSSRRALQNQAAFATSNSEGRFDLAVPSAGGWQLTASAHGYSTQRLDEHDGYSTAVIITEAAPRFEVTFSMTPASVIEGLILDEAGEAVRGANVALMYLPPPAPDDAHRRPQTRGQEMTDDRGFYKFGSVAPGDYQVRVTAHPWYASSNSEISVLGSGVPEHPRQDAGPDPLDVVYPVVWYPGVADPLSATLITLHGGDKQEANFQLLPVPGSRLHVAGPGSDNPNGSPENRGNPTVRPQAPNTFLTRLFPDGTEDPQISLTTIDGLNNAEVPGLSPGTYLVHQQSPSGNIASLSTIQVGAGSPRSIDLSESTPSATVTVKVDSAADQDSLQISFRDLDTGRTSYAQRFQDFGGLDGQFGSRAAGRRRNRATEIQPSPIASGRPDRTVNLPPGKYEVFLSGIGDIHLAGMEATGATSIGRTVTVGQGAAKLALHTAAGLGTVTGIVSFHGQSDPGAMVMLVPASLGNPAGLDSPARDQSNSDGSFEMIGLLPGEYILIAIDHGWDVNWSDPSTLRRYLLHGVPLDIRPSSDIRKLIQAQSP